VRVLVDTGPLVAIVSPDDQYHEACVRAMEELTPPMLTCWPVISEAAWLLRDYPGGFDRLLRSGDAVVWDILQVARDESVQIADVMKRYRSLRPQFADAALVHLANREDIGTIFTLDRRDFSVYRNSRKQAFRILP